VCRPLSDFELSVPHVYGRVVQGRVAQASACGVLLQSGGPRFLVEFWVPCPRHGEGGAFVSPMGSFSRFFLVAAFRQTLIGPVDHIFTDH
jgi:hypothetical protein